MPTRELIASITGKKKKDWQDKLSEINQRQLTTVGLFMQRFALRERRGLLDALRQSSVTHIPLVHIREDTTREEMRILQQHFGARYFTIHEFMFQRLQNWRGFYKQLYLEMSTDNRVAPYVQVEKIGGFCVDLAHYKKQSVAQTKDYVYVIEHLTDTPLRCNHLSGYDRRRNTDLHRVSSIRDFDYIYHLPHNLFGHLIAFEIFNSINDQLRYQALLVHSIKKKLGLSVRAKQ